MSANQIELDPATCRAVAADLFKAYDLIDSALAHTLRTTAGLIEAGKGTQIEPRRSQKIITEMTTCTSALLSGRQGLLTAHGLAHRVRMDSSVLEEVGCPRFTGEAKAPNLALVSSAA